MVWGLDDEKSGDTVICADIFPDCDALKESYGDLTSDGIRNVIEGEVDNANANMTGYKRVKRFKIREAEFEKTTTYKIKRFAITN